MDLRDLENDVQRRVGYSCFVTGGVTAKGPYLSFNGKERLLKIWISRDNASAEEIAGAVKDYMGDASQPAYKEIEMSS